MYRKRTTKVKEHHVRGEEAAFLNRAVVWVLLAFFVCGIIMVVYPSNTLRHLNATKYDHNVKWQYTQCLITKVMSPKNTQFVESVCITYCVCVALCDVKQIRRRENVETVDYVYGSKFEKFKSVATSSAFLTNCRKKSKRRCRGLSLIYSLNRMLTLTFTFTLCVLFAVYMCVQAPFKYARHCRMTRDRIWKM